MINHPLSLEELSKLGEKIYSEEFKQDLERNFMGQFAAIDVDQKKYAVDPDRLVAVEKAKKEFGDKLFYIVQIGSIQNPNTNFSSKRYAWHI